MIAISRICQPQLRKDERTITENEKLKKGQRKIKKFDRMASGGRKTKSYHCLVLTSFNTLPTVIAYPY